MSHPAMDIASLASFDALAASLIDECNAFASSQQLPPPPPVVDAEASVDDPLGFYYKHHDVLKVESPSSSSSCDHNAGVATLLDVVCEAAAAADASSIVEAPADASPATSPADAVVEAPWRKRARPPLPPPEEPVGDLAQASGERWLPNQKCQYTGMGISKAGRRHNAKADGSCAITNRSSSQGSRLKRQLKRAIERLDASQHDGDANQQEASGSSVKFENVVQKP
jgi:hypothetical protein